MNIYTRQFIVACPTNGEQIIYTLETRTDRMIHVENILTATKIVTGFHEAIADDLHARFGGFQKMTAIHHGVAIETHRGFA